MSTLIRAAYVFTADGPLLRGAGVLVEGEQIRAVGMTEDRDADVVDLGNVMLMPGLVNPHTHMELSDCSCAASSASFTDWIIATARRVEPDYAAAVREGIDQCLRFGVTTVGDISQQMEITRPIIAGSPLRCVSYGEVLGLAGRRGRFEELLPRAIDPAHQGDRLIVGLTPHAPYTVDLPGYRRCLAIARDRRLPLATHLAETADEAEFLARHQGPFRALWEQFGTWAEPVETFAGAPIEFARSVGLLDYPTLLAHVNYCDDREIKVLAGGRASVVYCPRTHAYFGHRPHRFPEMLAARVNVAIGTDSCASSPDLNLLADLRLVHELHPEQPAESLFRLVTINAARAVQLEARVGSIAVGKAADLVAFPVRTGDPLRELLEADVLPSHVWIGGEPISRSAPGRAGRGGGPRGS